MMMMMPAIFAFRSAVRRQAHVVLWYVSSERRFFFLVTFGMTAWCFAALQDTELELKPVDSCVVSSII